MLYSIENALSSWNHSFHVMRPYINEATCINLLSTCTCNRCVLDIHVHFSLKDTCNEESLSEKSFLHMNMCLVHSLWPKHGWLICMEPIPKNLVTKPEVERSKCFIQKVEFWLKDLFLVWLQIEAEFKEFSLAAATIADSFGISLAGVISIPTHNHICSLNLKMWSE